MAADRGTVLDDVGASVPGDAGASVPPPRVVIVGAGFAGLAALEELGRLPVEVVVVDQNAFHTFQPLLYQVATAGLNPGDVAYPARATLRRWSNTRFHLDQLVDVAWDEKKVVLASGARLGYDFLVLAFGASTNYFAVPGAEDHSLAIYTVDQARRVRDSIFLGLEHYAASSSRSRPASVVIVGGGATGVEMAGSLAELRNGLVPQAYPELSTDDLQIILVEQGERLLAAFDRRLGEYALDELIRRGVDLRLGQAVSKVGPLRVVLGDGSVIEPAITIWAAGVHAPTLAANLGLEQGPGGRLEVEGDLRTTRHADCFVVGDLAAARSHGELSPQLAQPAIQQGRHAARQIARLLAGEGTEAFVYRDKGMMATIGRRAAVVQLPHLVRLRGTLAWVAWLVLHLVELLGPRNRFSVMANLTWRYLRWPRGIKVIVGGTTSAEHEPRDGASHDGA
jgi:NADH:ubiquinone reductase (H+-translocating)